jgi:hypothetical protein
MVGGSSPTWPPPPGRLSTEGDFPACSTRCAHQGVTPARLMAGNANLRVFVSFVSQERRSS